MATIRLTTLRNYPGGGPSVREFYAWTKKEMWPHSAGEHEVIVLQIGDDIVEIWPVPDELRPLLEETR